MDNTKGGVKHWNDRYAPDEYAYGTKPNEFLRGALADLEAGRILFPAEGEGRNAVYAAEQGWSVDAFDTSAVGRDKALKLANSRGVNVSYELKSYIELDVESQYDAVAIIFNHIQAEFRAAVYQTYIDALKPGGKIILECFRTDQFVMDSGGPKNKDMLYSLDTIKSDFSGLEIVKLQEETRVLDEGPYHQGEAHLIQFIGTK